MDLSTTYLGMTLRTPLVPAASPLSREIDDIRRLEDAGASAIVLFSLFEEQLLGDGGPVQGSTPQVYVGGSDGSLATKARSVTFQTDPEAYLEHIGKAKQAVSIPVIASLNGTSRGGWISYARQIEQAGADALELNLFYMPSDLDMTAAAVEQNYIDVVRAVREVVQMPLAVKLGPYFSNMAHMAWHMDAAGAGALVLFNRFYQPDIDLRSRELRPRLLLSTAQDIRLPLHWISLLHGRVRANLAASGGIEHGEDVVKLLMAGADVAMLCSTLIRHGIARLGKIEQEMLDVMEEYEYESVSELHGSMSQRDCTDPATLERAHYMHALQSYRLPNHQGDQ